MRDLILWFRVLWVSFLEGFAVKKPPMGVARVEARPELDINKVDDARKFLTHAMQEALPGFDTIHFVDGSVKKVKDLSDEEAVRCAWDLLPIYQSKFPELVDIKRLH